MLSIIIMGAGSIGANLARIFRFDSHAVTLVDPHAVGKDAEAADLLTDPNLIKGHDYLINTAPIHDPSQMIGLLVACIRHGVHYIDTNEDVRVGRFIQQFATEDILFAPHSGLAPGLINVIGGYLHHHCRPDTLDLRVGALVRFVDNQLLHGLTWSPDGFVNQYLNDFEMIEAFDKKTHPSIFTAEGKQSGYTKYHNEFYLDGAQYECFPTSGGLGSMTALADGKLRSLLYRTIRVKGHAERIGKIFQRNAFCRKPIVEDIARYRVSNQDDFVLVIAKADGPAPEQQHTQIFKVVNGFYITGPMTAIQKCTIGGAAAVLDLHHRGLLPSRFVHQHEIPWPAYRNSRYIQEIGVH